MNFETIIQQYNSSNKNEVFSSEEINYKDFIMIDIEQYLIKMNVTIEYLLTHESSFGLDESKHMKNTFHSCQGELFIHKKKYLNLYVENTFGIISQDLFDNKKTNYISYFPFNYSNDFGYDAYNFTLFNRSSIQYGEKEKKYIDTSTDLLIDDYIDQYLTEDFGSNILEINPKSMNNINHFDVYILYNVFDLNDYIFTELKTQKYYYRYIKKENINCLYINEGTSSMRMFYFIDDVSI